MAIPKAALLSMIIKGHESSRTWVTVPDNLVSKAKALVRDGLLISSPLNAEYMPSPLGKMMGRDLDAEA